MRVSRQKAKVERALDDFEARNPQVRCVRMRPALVFERDVGSEIRRLFAEQWAPRFLFYRALPRIVPYHPQLCFQAVHSSDVGEAFRLALARNVRGAFNLASNVILDSALLAWAFNARLVPMSVGWLRGLAAATRRMHMQHSDPGWVDLCLESPLIDCTRAETVLGWLPQRAGLDDLLELPYGIRNDAGSAAPPVARPAVPWHHACSRSPHVSSVLDRS